jgi:hypothetical protein
VVCSINARFNPATATLRGLQEAQLRAAISSRESAGGSEKNGALLAEPRLARRAAQRRASPRVIRARLLCGTPPNLGDRKANVLH